MDGLILALVILLLLSVWILIAAVVWSALRRRDRGQEEQMAALRAEMEQLRRQVDRDLSTVSQHVSTFGDVREGIGRVREATERILVLGEDIAALQDILRAPKPRGGLGEIMLENLLSQFLPGERYCLQYSFSDGMRVDAIIRLADHIVPIDAKFPLENFQRILEAGNDRDRASAQRAFVRDVKRRVDETARYIRPDEGTFEFVMMYVPAENVYYEVLCAHDLFEYALERHVVPISPNSCFAYLSVIVFGLRGLEIEETARLLVGQLSKLQREYVEVGDAFSTLGRHISHAQGKYNEVDALLRRFGDRLTDVTSGVSLPRGPRE